MEHLLSSPYSASIAKAPFENVIESYLRYYAAGSGHTARAKQLDLMKFLEFLARYRNKREPMHLKVSDWDLSSVQRFLEECLTHGEAPATVARRLATLKHMGRTLAEKIPGFTNPAKEVKAPRVQVARPKALSPGEIRRTIARAEARLKERSSFIRLRNRTILLFMLDTGLRADEVRTLRMHQLDGDLTWIKNVRTKGRRYRNVYITSSMREDLHCYLDARSQELTRLFGECSPRLFAQCPVFISSYRASLERPESLCMGHKTLWRTIRELSVGTPLHPHLLRHSFATELLNSSNDIRLVAQALGHSDVRVTMRYTERMDHEVATALEHTRARSRRR